MNIQLPRYKVPTCPCAARLGAGGPTLCRKCTARKLWLRHHQPRGSHSGADRGIRTRRISRHYNGGAE